MAPILIHYNNLEHSLLPLLSTKGRIGFWEEGAIILDAVYRGERGLLGDAGSPSRRQDVSRINLALNMYAK